MTQEKWLVAPGQTKIIDVELVRALKVSLIGGKVDIIGSDEPGARIEVHSVSGLDLKISIVDDARRAGSASSRSRRIRITSAGDLPKPFVPRRARRSSSTSGGALSRTTPSRR